jgi:hypothetical protein
MAWYDRWNEHKWAWKKTKNEREKSAKRKTAKKNCFLTCLQLRRKVNQWISVAGLAKERVRTEQW